LLLARLPTSTLLPYTTLFRSLSTSNTAPAPQISNYAPSGTNANQMQAQRRAALEELLNLANPQAFSREYQNVFDRSLFLAEQVRSEEHTSELQSRENLVCRLL